jgi:ABC-type branched-subunit amino acid transport system permease subunit
VGFVSPEVFGMNIVILGFTMLYFGGIGTITGPLVTFSLDLALYLCGASTRVSD